MGKQVLKGYLAEDFEEVFRRYIPPSEIEALRAELAAAQAIDAEGDKAEGTAAVL